MFMKRESRELVGTRFANTIPDLRDPPSNSEDDVLTSVPPHELESTDLHSHKLLPGDVSVRESTSAKAAPSLADNAPLSVSVSVFVSISSS